MNLKPLIIIGVPFLLCPSCAEKKTETLSPEARDLFRKSSDLIRSYTDSIGKAKDSVTWAAIDRRFEDRLTKLNYSYPPDTDLHLSQGENDTLFALTTRYVKARAESHTRILRGPAPADTVADLEKKN